MSKHMMIVGLLLLAAGMLTACSLKPEANVSEEIGSMESDMGETAGGKGLAGLFEVTEDKVSYDAGSAAGEGCVVNAELDIPDAGHAAVYYQEQREMTAGAVKDMAAGIFETGSCQAVKPFAAYNQKELEEAAAGLKEQALAARKQARDEGKTDWMASSRALDSQLVDVRELLDAYEGEPSAWKEDDFYALQDGSRILIYQGLIGEETYFLAAVEKDGQVILYQYKKGESWSQNRDFFGADYEERKIDELNDTLYGKNQCMLDMEEAKQIAESFLERYGLTNMLMMEAKDAVPVSGVYVGYDEEMDLEQESIPSATATAYSFRFVRSYDNVPLEYYDGAQTGYSFDEDGTEDKEPKQEQYHVIVGDEGVLYAEVRTIYDVRETLTEQSTLLTFAQIDNIAKEKLGAIPGEVNRITFCYKNVTFENCIVLMPVWIYSDSFEVDGLTGESRYPILILNAVDGSVVD